MLLQVVHNGEQPLVFGADKAQHGELAQATELGQNSFECLEKLKFRAVFRANVPIPLPLQAALDTHGTLDFAFNNSGVLPPSKPLAEMSEEYFNTTLEVDLKGVFLYLKYELAYMAKVGKGAIVNTASVAGIV